MLRSADSPLEQAHCMRAPGSSLGLPHTTLSQMHKHGNARRVNLRAFMDPSRKRDRHETEPKARQELSTVNSDFLTDWAQRTCGVSHTPC